MCLNPAIRTPPPPQFLDEGTDPRNFFFLGGGPVSDMGTTVGGTHVDMPQKHSNFEIDNIIQMDFTDHFCEKFRISITFRFKTLDCIFASIFDLVQIETPKTVSLSGGRLVNSGNKVIFFTHDS